MPDGVPGTIGGMTTICGMDEQALYEAMQARLQGPGDIYAQMNALRDWVNANCPGFELYLEDVWNEKTEGETHFEYILRSRQTLNETRVLAYDIYQNHRDAGGVWHLDEYVRSVKLIDDCRELVAFMKDNPPSP